MKAVIMAGGFGTRIHPLTINLPKPMIPVFNRPIMLHIIDLLKRHGITELVLLLYHQPENIKHFFGDGSEFGVKITYVTPLQDFGTAGAVKAAAKHLDGRFLIISGDLLTDFDLGAILRYHEEKQAVATITLTPVVDPLQFGVVITDKEGRITKFLEKPGWGEVFSDTVNTGIYVLEPEVLELIPEGENRDWSKEIFPQLLEERRPLYGCRMEGYWQDVGNTDAYLEACRDVFAGKIQLTLDQKLDPASDRNLFVGNECQLTPEAMDRMQGMVVLGDNSQVLGQAQLHNCVIGRNCVIEDGAQLENAVLWDNVYVKQGARIHNAVCCHRVRVGSGAAIEEGAVIADDSDVGNDAVVRRDVKVWPNKTIEDGATVTANLIWGEKWRRSLFEGNIVRGLTNIELTPEFVAKLGAAYGSTLPKDANVLIGRDAFRSSRMLKRAFAGGLLSAGVNARDAKCIPLPLLRYKLSTFGEVGGVHFRQSEKDPKVTEIVFYDADSVAISTNAAKTIERVYYKENFRRAHFAEPGGITEMTTLTRFYREGFLRALDRDAISKAAPKVVLDLNHSAAAAVLPELLTELGCEVIELNSHIDETPRAHAEVRRLRSLEQLSRIVVTLEAQAGFVLGPSGDRVNLVDETGQIIDCVESLAILAALMGRVEKEGQIVLPTPAPHTIDTLAQRQGLSVLRVKNDDRAIIEATKPSRVRFAGTLDCRFAFTDFHHCGDGLFTVAKTLELLAHSGATLAGIRRELPRAIYRHLEIPCPWQFKGGIMRRMSEDSADHEASFTDGVKIFFRDGAWVLVVADAHRPVAHIFTEAEDLARAEDLLETYRAKVEAWKAELREP